MCIDKRPQWRCELDRTQFCPRQDAILNHWQASPPCQTSAPQQIVAVDESIHSLTWPYDSSSCCIKHVSNVKDFRSAPSKNIYLKTMNIERFSKYPHAAVHLFQDCSKLFHILRPSMRKKHFSNFVPILFHFVPITGKYRCGRGHNLPLQLPCYTRRLLTSACKQSIIT